MKVGHQEGKLAHVLEGMFAAFSEGPSLASRVSQSMTKLFRGNVAARVLRLSPDPTRFPPLRNVHKDREDRESQKQEL